jgi:hypothetical protein
MEMEAQRAYLNDILFGVPYLVSYRSTFNRLEPVRQEVSGPTASRRYG